MRTIDRIEQLLIEKGVPRRKVKRALADACNTSYQGVRAWFTGETKEISLPNLTAIAKKWGTTTDYLATGDTSSLKDPAEKIEEQINKLPPETQLELYERLGRKILERLKKTD